MLVKILTILAIILIWFSCMMSFKVIEHISRKWTGVKQTDITIKQGHFWLSWLWKIPINKDLIPEDFTKITYSWGVSKDLPDYKIELMKSYKFNEEEKEDKNDSSWNDLPMEVIPRKKTFYRAIKRLNKL